MTQNFRAAVPDIPFIFLAHSQNRRPAYGVEYTRRQYAGVKRQLEEISGSFITDAKLRDAILIYNRSRQARRKFVCLAAQHPDIITPIKRSAVLKSAYFMEKNEYNALLHQLNAELLGLPPSQRQGIKILTSGILADSKNLLQIIEDNGLSIAADDVAQESRSFRLDVPESDDSGTAISDPLQALALQFAGQDFDPLLYDPSLNKRPQYIVKLARESGAQGVLILMMQFCDPEEIEYPSLKKALDEAGIPSVLIGIDQQMKDFGQARTQIQAFAEVLRARQWQS